MSWTELHMLGSDHASNSCRKRLKNCDNSSVLDLECQIKTQDITCCSPEIGGKVGFPLHFLPPWRSHRLHDVVVQNCEKQCTTSSTSFEEQMLKSRFHVLSLDTQTPRFAAGNIRRCRLRKYAFSMATILVVLAGVVIQWYWSVNKQLTHEAPFPMLKHRQFGKKRYFACEGMKFARLSPALNISSSTC